MLRSLAVLVPIVALAVACSSGSSSAKPGTALDCAYLAGSSNCWKSTLAAASSCVPGHEVGKFSADMKSCTFGSGKLVTFDAPVVLPPPSGTTYNLTITDGGAACLRFAQPDAATFIATTSAGTAKAAATPSSYTLSCPDGSSATTSTPGSLLTCGGEAGLLAALPGTIESSSSSSLSLSIAGTGDAVGMTLFLCRM